MNEMIFSQIAHFRAKIHRISQGAPSVYSRETVKALGWLTSSTFVLGRRALSLPTPADCETLFFGVTEILGLLLSAMSPPLIDAAGISKEYVICMHCALRRHLSSPGYPQCLWV